VKLIGKVDMNLSLKCVCLHLCVRNWSLSNLRHSSLQ